MSNNNFYCVIMAGGTGRRFWPYSRKALPKQFLDFFGSGQTLIQQTYERYKRIILPENIYISTHKDYKEIVLEMLPEMDESRLIVEEEHRNTAPAIAYASHVIQKINPDATVIIAPSDNVILKPEEFRQAVLKGMEFASHSGNLLVMGVRPTYPETGYGYIQISEEHEGDFCKIKTFIEKPAREFAEVFVQSNEFYWNSGIFIWHIDTIMRAFHEMMSDVCPRLEADRPDFSSCPNSSFDTSIMEKADNVYVQPCDFGWADVGTWGALHDLLPKDGTKGTGKNLSTALFGRWSDLIVGMWGVLDIMSDPYTKSASGDIRVIAFQSFDTNIRYAQSFAKCTDIDNAAAADDSAEEGA